MLPIVFTLLLVNEEKEGNVLFNYTLKTFLIWLYGVGHMIKDDSYRKMKLLLPLHGLLSFRLSARGLLYAPPHRQDSNFMAFVNHISKWHLGNVDNTRQIKVHMQSVLILTYSVLRY